MEGSLHALLDLSKIDEQSRGWLFFSLPVNEAEGYGNDKEERNLL